MVKLVCRSCGTDHPANSPLWRCPCGGLLDLEFDAKFPLKKILKREQTLWRYREALPIENDQNIISFGEGFTPMIPVGFNGRSVWIKQDHLLPSGSFKDRGASVLISKVKELGMNHFIEDSSGNAGCAIAAYASRAGVSCDIYLPASTVREKAARVEQYGAILHRIPGGREATADAALQAAKDHYYASHYWNPFFFHGTKTFCFEVCEQLHWEAPDTLILPAGNGTLVLGASIGFNDLLNADIIERIPKIIAIQAELCAPLHKAFHSNLYAENRDVCQETVAEGIAIPNPIRSKQIVEAVRETGGTFLKVSEDEIATSLGKMIEKGYSIEPTSAATIAGIEQYLQRNNPDCDLTIVSTFTGCGSKTHETTGKLPC